jgi:hypothetical protein
MDNTANSASIWSVYQQSATTIVVYGLNARWITSAAGNSYHLHHDINFPSGQQSTYSNSSAVETPPYSFTTQTDSGTATMFNIFITTTNDHRIAYLIVLSANPSSTDRANLWNWGRARLGI